MIAHVIAHIKKILLINDTFKFFRLIYFLEKIFTNYFFKLITWTCIFAAIYFIFQGKKYNVTQLILSFSIILIFGNKVFWNFSRQPFDSGKSSTFISHSCSSFKLDISSICSISWRVSFRASANICSKSFSTFANCLQKSLDSFILLSSFIKDWSEALSLIISSSSEVSDSASISASKFIKSAISMKI